MSLNFSKKCQNEISFSDLNYLIDQWVSEIQEKQNVFSLQSDEINRLSHNANICKDKLEVFNQRINLAKCFQGQIEQNMIYIRNCLGEIEQMVIKVEKQTNVTTSKCCPADVYRQNTYKLATNLDQTFYNFKEIIEEFQTLTGQVNRKCDAVDNIDQVAQLLQAHLQQLENIEMKIYEMKNKLNQIECYKQHVLARLRLKENKMY